MDVGPVMGYGSWRAMVVLTGDYAVYAGSFQAKVKAMGAEEATAGAEASIGAVRECTNKFTVPVD